jgi:hypothetical protein
MPGLIILCLFTFACLLAVNFRMERIEKRLREEVPGLLKNLATRDTQRMDFLEALNKKADYSGYCILRESESGRGWRLHETNRDSAYYSVRQAIDARMPARKEKDNG